MCAFALVAVCVPLFAFTDQSVTVKSSSVKNGVVVIEAQSSGKAVEFECFLANSHCSSPAPGDYEMLNATTEGIYNDCTNVVLYKATTSGQKEKVGVYCWLNSGDSYTDVVSSVQQPGISVSEAKELVGLALHSQGFPSSSPHCEVEILDKNGEQFVPNYYAFFASCDFPNTAATSPWGTYLVSPRTGDVLNFDTCKWVEYRDLRERQKRVMLQTGATESAEQTYRDATGCSKTK